MSLIGTLEQLSLANILQRIEMYEKNGVLIVRQGETWVELYIRSGRLMCIGPVRTTATLGDRLLQDGVISPQALQETLLAIGGAQPSETRMALTLMDLGYVGHEDLRAWATKKTTDVLQILLGWTSGEIHFEEDVAPAPDRLLVAISISTLLSLSTPSTPIPQQPISSGLYSSDVQEQPRPRPVAPVTPSAFAKPRSRDVSKIPTLTSPSQFLSSEVSYPFTESLSPTFTHPKDTFPAPSLVAQTQFSQAASTLQPIPATMPITPKYIDTSFMRPDMVLIPADLSALREQNPSVQLTPEQWRLLTRVDGRTSLGLACQELSLLPEQVCLIAGELLTEGLIQLSMPTNEFSPISSELLASGLSNGYVAPGYAAATAQPWSPALPSSDVAPQFSSSIPFETQSQWGNGGNGATFVPGQGWVASPQQSQQGGPFGLFGNSGVHAPIGIERDQVY